MIAWPDDRKPSNANQLKRAIASLKPAFAIDIGKVDDARTRSLLTDLLELIELCAVAADAAECNRYH